MLCGGVAWVFFRALEGFVWLNGFNANIGFMDAYGDNFNYKWLHKWLNSLITSLESLETPLMDYEQSVAYQLQSIQSCQLPKYCCLFLLLV